MNLRPALALIAAVVLTTPTHLHAQAPRKDPLVAGLLSALVLPGLGSFYAGHSGHGIRHVAIEAAGIAVVIGATRDGDIFTSSSASVGILGLGVLLANAIWATVTAVDDAHAHNRAIGPTSARIVGRLYAEPGVVALPHATGVLVLRIAF